MKSKQLLITPLALAAAIYSAGGMAAVSSDEAARLNASLTPVGAEKAGNADGRIPAWTGGMTQPPAGYVAGGNRIDPFADEKPDFVITAANFQQYADKLTVGQKALFEKYPDTFRMPVYPTHRTAAAPKWVYTNTHNNALSAELSDGGNGVMNASGGYPFPLPNNGIEAIWNHNLRWQSDGSKMDYLNLAVYDTGNMSIGGGTVWNNYPFYDNKGQTENNDVWHVLVQYNLPARRKGEVFTVRDPLNQNETPRQAWQYIPGQRRVRRAPTIAFDTPNSSSSGLTTYDDSSLFNGSPERYDWTLVGKQEMFVPYNNNRMLEEASKGIDQVKKIFTPRHMNPDYARWELHRVWIVEAKLKEGKRHVYAKRRFYLDEDSWTVLASDLYDGRGEIWRTGFANMLNAYDVPATLNRGYWQVDLQGNAYTVLELDTKPAKFYEGEDDKFFSPNGVRDLSIR